jgi:acetolactate synthase-1/2/3 large subunit
MVMGARLDMETIGHNLENFAPRASKIVIDVDYAELEKFKASAWDRITIDLDYPEKIPLVDGSFEWLAKCKGLYNRLRYELEGTENGEFVEPYSFIRELSDVAIEGDVFVPGSSGVQSCAFMQAFKVKTGQRILLCNTIGSMGMEPMAIGAAIASNRRVIVITGDGGFSQSVGELEVVKRMNLPIHYFVFCNQGYGSISAMQDNRMDGFRVGSTVKSGLTLPNLQRVAALYEMPYFEMKTNADLTAIKGIIENDKATLTSVNSSLGFRYAMKVESSIRDGVFVPDDLADMAPKIDWKGLL